jgi:hypothetical protein
MPQQTVPIGAHVASIGDDETPRRRESVKVTRLLTFVSGRKTETRKMHTFVALIAVPVIIAIGALQMAAKNDSDRRDLAVILIITLLIGFGGP